MSCCVPISASALRRHFGSLGAKQFYAVITVAMVLGIALNYAGLEVVRMLFTTAVTNGLLAPPLFSSSFY